MSEGKRPDWNEYFFNMLDGVASRSTCIRRQIGVIITQDNRIVATGYNGQPPGIEHCIDKGSCLREELKVPSGQRHELCRVVHAEENAILQASHFGIKLEGATLYSKVIPCSLCTKSILSVGIKKVIYGEMYPDDLARDLRKEATWVKFEQYKSPVIEIEKMELYLDEELKSLLEYPDYYISNYGRVFKGTKIDKFYNIIDVGEWIKSKYDSIYQLVTVCLKRFNKVEDVSVGWLVAETWLENPDNLQHLNWKDGNYANNHVDNLEWVCKKI